MDPSNSGLDPSSSNMDPTDGGDGSLGLFLLLIYLFVAVPVLITRTLKRAQAEDEAIQRLLRAIHSDAHAQAAVQAAMGGSAIPYPDKPAAGASANAKAAGRALLYAWAAFTLALYFTFIADATTDFDSISADSGTTAYLLTACFTFRTNALFGWACSLTLTTVLAKSLRRIEIERTSKCPCEQCKQAAIHAKFLDQRSGAAAAAAAHSSTVHDAHVADLSPDHRYRQVLLTPA